MAAPINPNTSLNQHSLHQSLFFTCYDFGHSLNVFFWDTQQNSFPINLATFIFLFFYFAQAARKLSYPISHTSLVPHYFKKPIYTFTFEVKREFTSSDNVQIRTKNGWKCSSYPLFFGHIIFFRLKSIFCENMAL